MTTAQALQVFDILQDTYGSPYFPDDWKLKMFNQAQYTYLNDLFPDNQGGRVNLEQDSNTLANVKSLIYNLSVNVTSGSLTVADIITQLVIASGEASAKPLRILALAVSSGGQNYEVKYMKHNDNWSFHGNVFKAPSFPNNVRYTQISQGYQIYPTSTTAQFFLTVLKTPRDISLSPAVNPEYDTDYPVYAIIAKMLKISGIPVNDAELISNVQATAISQ